MTTLIVKEKGNEIIESNIQFRVLINTSRLDLFTYDTISEAKQRIQVLRKIFQHSTFDILIVQ